MLRSVMLTAVVGLVAVSPGLALVAKVGPDKQTQADIAAVKAYLEKNKADKKWDVGPMRMDSPEIKAAYPQARFYFVSSTVPGPLITGIPPTPQMQAEHEKNSKEKMAKYISLTVRIDAEGKATAMDYGAGLMPIKTEADAKTAAAAILSLHHENGGPVHVPVGKLAAKDVKAVQTKKGWTCTVPLPNANVGFLGTWGGTGTVTFDTDSPAVQVTDVTKKVGLVAPYTGPYPPSAPKK